MPTSARSAPDRMILRIAVILTATLRAQSSALTRSPFYLSTMAARTSSTWSSTSRSVRIPPSWNERLIRPSVRASMIALGCRQVFKPASQILTRPIWRRFTRTFVVVRRSKKSSRSSRRKYRRGFKSAEGRVKSGWITPPSSESLTNCWGIRAKCFAAETRFRLPSNCSRSGRNSLRSIGTELLCLALSAADSVRSGSTA